MFSSLQRAVPLLATLRGYDRQQAGHDLLGALLVSLLLTPQALAYAQLAGLPAEAGLFASILPLLAYALFGASPGVALAVGPVAILALMTASALQPLGLSGAAYAAAALSLTLLVGLLLSLLALLRLGFLANFLSHPVIAGFVSGSALLIAVSQIRHLLGVAADGHNLPQLLPALWAQLPASHGPTVAVGLGAVLLLVLLRGPLPRLLQRLGLRPAQAQLSNRLAPLLVVGLALLLSALLQLDSQGVRVVGAVTAHLPGFSLPSFEPALLLELLPSAALIALVGFVESISIAQSLAARQRQSVQPDRELFGQGAANLAAAFSGGLPVSASFSRSAIAVDSGARTPMVGVFTAVLMLLVLVLLTPLLRLLPQAVLAASIIVAVLGLIDLRSLRRTWRYAWQDGVAQAATLLGVLLVGVESGIVIGVALSLLLFLWRTSRPHIAVVGQLPGSEHFRNVERYAVVQSEAVLSLRVDESLYFPNARYLEERIAELVAARPAVRHLVLMCSGVNLIDASALDSLETIDARLRSAGVQLHLSEVKGPVLDQLKRSDFFQRFAGQVFVSQYAALCQLDPETAQRALMR